MLGLRSRRVLAAVALLVLTSVGVWAAKLVVATNFAFPGIDANGMMDSTNPGTGIGAVEINTKSGKVRVTGYGFVENASGRKQIYKDGPAILEALSLGATTIAFKSAKYRVAVDGTAKLALSGKIAPPTMP